MTIGDVLKESWISLSANKLRSFLTILGIIIGVSAVVVMVAAGQAVQLNINQQFSEIGTNMLFIRAGKMNFRGISGGSKKTLTFDDLEAIKNNIPEVIYSVPVETTSAQTVYGNKNWSASIYGSYPDFKDAQSWTLKDGTYYDENALKSMSNYAVVGSEVVEELFAEGENPIGKTIRISNQPFFIIGVLNSKGDSGGMSADNTIHIPISTFKRKLYGSKFPNAVNAIILKLSTDQANAKVSEEITQLLRERHKLKADDDDDFTITDMKQIADTLNNVTGFMQLLLVTIASISLIVGSIGIMNMMLVAVAERTREIGIRKAIGAKERDIMTQFLAESIMISFAGSFIGLIFGVILSQVGGVILGYTVPISIWSVIVSVLVAVIVGILSGVFPAYKATKLNPIESLRYE